MLSAKVLVSGAFAAGLVLFLLRPARGADSVTSSEELVRQAHAHEATHEDDLAVRRYMEALTLDATSESAWMGLGALRMRLGDLAEAERVYTSALEHVPGLRVALVARARARWALGHRPEAEADLDAFATIDGDAASLRELAEWYGSDGRTPAQLATWRRLLTPGNASARRGPLVREAVRRMVRALVVLVDMVLTQLHPRWIPTSRGKHLQRSHEELARLTSLPPATNAACSARCAESKCASSMVAPTRRGLATSPRRST